MPLLSSASTRRRTRWQPSLPPATRFRPRSVASLHAYPPSPTPTAHHSSSSSPPRLSPPLHSPSLPQMPRKKAAPKAAVVEPAEGEDGGLEAYELQKSVGSSSFPPSLSAASSPAVGSIADAFCLCAMRSGEAVEGCCESAGPHREAGERKLTVFLLPLLPNRRPQLPADVKLQKEVPIALVKGSTVFISYLAALCVPFIHFFSSPSANPACSTSQRSRHGDGTQPQDDQRDACARLGQAADVGRRGRAAQGVEEGTRRCVFPASSPHAESLG